MLRFSKANTKLKAMYNNPDMAPYLTDKRRIYSLDLLSGHSCPFAEQCFARVDTNEAGKKVLFRGEFMKFQCFSASQELQYKNVYNLRKKNLDTLQACKTEQEMVNTISLALPTNAGIVRIHVAGDFFSAMYFRAWLKVIADHPNTLFYAYTKALPTWIKYKKQVDSLPNFVLTASDGGTYDELIVKHNLRQAIVIFRETDTALEIDHDDSHAANPSKRHESFALLIHGMQAAGSEAGKAVRALNGVGSYR